jgi:hypothetical protein
MFHTHVCDETLQFNRTIFLLELVCVVVLEKQTLEMN